MLNDIDDFYYVATQKEVLRYLPDKMMSYDDICELVNWFLDCYKHNSIDKIIKFPLAIIDKETNKLIGDCGLGPSPYIEGELEIFYILSKDYWGKGIMTEAASVILNYGLKKLYLNKIIATVLPQNIASKRVLEKIGLIYRRTIDVGGYYYSISKDEYKK